MINSFESTLNLICCCLLLFNTLFSWSKSFRLCTKLSTLCLNISTQVYNILLTIVLITRWIVSGHVPLSNLYESSLFFIWSLNLLNNLLYNRTKEDWSSIIIAPTSLIIQVFATFGLPLSMQKSNLLIPALQSNWLLMHVSMMIISYSLLVLGCLLSITFIFIDFDLYKFNFINTKSIKTDSSYVIEEWLENTLFFARQNCLLHDLDYWSYRLIGIGFPFLTIGILSGSVWANEAWGSYWSWDPKETWAMVTWIIFAIYLHSRMIQGWNGQKTALLALLGFFVVWGCYLGVNLLGKGLHSYGWLN